MILCRQLVSLFDNDVLFEGPWLAFSQFDADSYGSMGCWTGQTGVIR